MNATLQTPVNPPAYAHQRHIAARLDRALTN